MLGNRSLGLNNRLLLNIYCLSWWHHQMEIFSALLANCAGNSPVTDEFPTQRPMTQNFDVFFDLDLNKRLSKQWLSSWFETPSRPVSRHRYVNILGQTLTEWNRPPLIAGGRYKVCIVITLDKMPWDIKNLPLLVISSGEHALNY